MFLWRRKRRARELTGSRQIRNSANAHNPTFLMRLVRQSVKFGEKDKHIIIRRGVTGCWNTTPRGLILFADPREGTKALMETVIRGCAWVKRWVILDARRAWAPPKRGLNAFSLQGRIACHLRRVELSSRILDGVLGAWVQYINDKGSYTV